MAKHLLTCGGKRVLAVARGPAAIGVSLKRLTKLS